MQNAHNRRKHAQVCQDCWFHQQGICALPNPTRNSCANKRTSLITAKETTTPVVVKQPIKIFDIPRVQTPAATRIEGAAASRSSTPRNEVKIKVQPPRENTGVMTNQLPGFDDGLSDRIRRRTEARIQARKLVSR